MNEDLLWNDKVLYASPVDSKSWMMDLGAVHMDSKVPIWKYKIGSAVPVESKKLEYGPSTTYAGVPSSLGFAVGTVIFQLSGFYCTWRFRVLKTGFIAVIVAHLNGP